MAELTYLGKLLGMPDVLDPMFPLAYTTFFGMDSKSIPLGPDPTSLQSSNVSLLEYYSRVVCVTVLVCYFYVYVACDNSFHTNSRRYALFMYMYMYVLACAYECIYVFMY